MRKWQVHFFCAEVWSSQRLQLIQGAQNLSRLRHTDLIRSSNLIRHGRSAIWYDIGLIGSYSLIMSHRLSARMMSSIWYLFSARAEFGIQCSNLVPTAHRAVVQNTLESQHTSKYSKSEIQWTYIAWNLHLNISRWRWKTPLDHSTPRLQPSGVSQLPSPSLWPQGPSLSSLASDFHTTKRYKNGHVPHVSSCIRMYPCHLPFSPINFYLLMSYSYPDLRSHTSPEPATHIAPNHTHYTPCFCRFRVTPGLPLPGVLRARRFFVSSFCYVCCYVIAIYIYIFNYIFLFLEVEWSSRKMEMVVFWNCGDFYFAKICPKVLTHFLVTTSSEKKKIGRIVKANCGIASQFGDISGDLSIATPFRVWPATGVFVDFFAGAERSGALFCVKRTRPASGRWRC